jgi:hypothetical protein
LAASRNRAAIQTNVVRITREPHWEGQQTVYLPILRRPGRRRWTASGKLRCRYWWARSPQWRSSSRSCSCTACLILLDYATIKAPYDGIVTRRWSHTGAFIQSAVSGKPDPLFTIVRTDRLRIIADLPESEAGLVRIGLPATFQANIARSAPLAGRVARVAGALDAATRSMRIEIELDEPNPGLYPGASGSV